MGWGEHTFTRYYDEDMPTRQYLDVLNRIFDNLSYYLSILEKNKSRLSSDKTSFKSKKATESLLAQEISFTSKIDNAIGYYTFGFTKKSLLRSGIFLCFFKHFMFIEECEA